MDRKVINNKGVSLVEVIVALAVGSIVLAALSLLIIQGVNNYRTQSVSASIQNEANITLNQMSDYIMEGTCLELCADSQGNTLYIKMKEDFYFVYDKDKERLYQSDNNTIVNGALLCEDLKEFKVRILENSLMVDSTNDTVAGLSNPIQLKIDIKIEKLDIERRVNRVVVMRNDMEKIGFTVENGTTADILHNSIYNLSNYITSDN